MKEIFKVIIDNKSYSVFDIPNKTHESLNGEPNTWWIYIGVDNPKHTPYNKSFVAHENDSEIWWGYMGDGQPNFVPYCRSVLRQTWEVNIKQYNHSKQKWDAVSFRNTCSVEMKCNGKLIYSFTTNGTAMDAKVQCLQVQLTEHPYNFFDAQTENGRKIYFHGLPATIEPMSETWNITIYPDYSEGFDRGFWWEEYGKRTMIFYDTEGIDDFEEIKADGYIVWGDALSDGNINWFRA